MMGGGGLVESGGGARDYQLRRKEIEGCARVRAGAWKKELSKKKN